MSESFPKAHLESLWAPWRVEYFQAEHQVGSDFLSEAAQTQDDAFHLVITRRKAAFPPDEQYPLFRGTLNRRLPYRKVSDMTELTDDEVLELWHLCIHGQRLLKECVKAQGLILAGIGQVCGCGRS